MTDRLALSMAIGAAAVLVLIAATGHRVPDIPIEEFESVTVSAEGFHIRLTSGCTALFVAANPWQIESIKDGIGGKTGERPGSHDLMADIAEGLGGKVKMALVSDFQGGAYYARLVLESGGGTRLLDLDARPSDAIALAVRAGAPVYVRRELMNKYGADVCGVETM